MNSGTRYYFSNISFPILFLRNIHRGVLSIEDADEEQVKVIKKLSNIVIGEKPIKKESS